MADQIFADGPVDAPAKYEVPGSAQIVPIAVQALLNGSGASGDYVPTLIFRSQAGHVIARVPTSTTVTAGDDAEVSWFPGVKAGGGSPSAFLNQTYLAQANHGGQVITTNTVTPITFLTYTSAPGWNPGAFGNPFPGPANPVEFVDAANVIFELQVQWTAGNYLRNISLDIANPPEANETYSPVLYGEVAPDDNQMTLVAVVLGLGGPPATAVTANVYHERGVNSTITAELTARSINGKIFFT